MGSTNINGQKSILNSKYVMLLVSLILTGIIMKYLSPPGKLDSTFFYSYSYVEQFFSQLTPEQKTSYLFAELFDYWYMINYSLILFILFKRSAVLPDYQWLVWVPGILDFFENTLIVYYLKTAHLSPLHQARPAISAIKWLIGLFLLGLWLLKFLARFRKS